MPLWGKTDDAANSAKFAVSSIRQTSNSSNRTALYGNTTARALRSTATGQAIVGQFGVDVTEARVYSGPIVSIQVTNPGSGYTANASVTVTATNGGSSGAANAQSNSTGRIAALNVSTAGSGYATSPTIAVAAPAATAFNANTAVSGGTGGGANSVITISSAPYFAAGDKITYAVAAGNTAISPLVSGTQYWVQFANATVVALSSTLNGTRITLVPSAVSETGHTLRGETAEGVAAIGGGGNKHATPGWNLRREGTGGRAGRVTYECLAAVRLTSDGSDDTILNDS